MIIKLQPNPFAEPQQCHLICFVRKDEDKVNNFLTDEISLCVLMLDW